MTRDDGQRWDERYLSADVWPHERHPFTFLVKHTPPSPGGLALDLACGLGHNALWLAGQGYQVLGVDVSRVGLRRAAEAARESRRAGHVSFAQADLDSFRPAPQTCDLICVIRYLNRDLFPALAAALRPGGVLIYATFNLHWLEAHPEGNRAYLLQPGELRGAFPGLALVDYEEREGLSCLAARKHDSP